MVFKNTWKYIKGKCLKKRHVDSKYDTRSEKVDVHFENKDNWDACPHIHKEKPRKGARRRKKHPGRKGNWHSYLKSYE